VLVSVGLNVYVVTIPNGHDPDEFVNAHGKQEWEKLMSSALYWVEFLIKDFATTYDLNKMEEKNKFIKDALNVIKTLPTQSEQEIYLKMVQDMTNVTVSVLKSDLGGITEVSDVKEENIKVDSRNINLKENAYVKAVKFIISALLYKKEYARLDGTIRDNLLNSDYIKIYDYIKSEYDNCRVPIVSKIFDMFDVEDSGDIYDIVNYVFATGEDNEKYYEDCVNIIVKSGLIIEKDRLLSLLSKTKDPDERKNIMSQIQNIILKEKKK
jgi:DNA primase